MGSLGTPELLIILVIIVLLFGAGRVRTIGGDLGGAIKAFREGMREEPNEINADTEE